MNTMPIANVIIIIISFCELHAINVFVRFFQVIFFIQWYVFESSCEEMVLLFKVLSINNKYCVERVIAKMSFENVFTIGVIRVKCMVKIDLSRKRYKKRKREKRWRKILRNDQKWILQYV